MIVINREKKMLAIAITTIAIAVFSRCADDVGQLPQKPLPAVVSFSQDIIPFFNTSCAISGCHTGPNPTAGLDLSAPVAYTDLFQKREINTTDPQSSNLYIFMNNGMPPSGRLPYDVALVLKWIDQGANNN